MTIVKVVVTPGQGALRRRLVDRLLACGHDARALAGPLPSGPELRELLADAGAVLHGAGGLDGPVDLELADTRRVAKAAATTGAHLLLVVPGPVAALEAVLESVPDASWTLQPTTTLCGDLASWLGRLRVGPVVPVPRELVLQPVDAGEVADRLVQLLRAGPAGRVPVFGGPAIRPIDDLARAWVRATRAPRRRGVVVATPRVPSPNGAVTFPDRRCGEVTWEAWLGAELGSAGGDRRGGGRQPVGAERLGG